MAAGMKAQLTKAVMKFVFCSKTNPMALTYLLSVSPSLSSTKRPPKCLPIKKHTQLPSTLATHAIDDVSGKVRGGAIKGMGLLEKMKG